MTIDRSTLIVAVSGSIFGVLALTSYHLVGWRHDGWLLVVAGLAHLLVVVKERPRLDAFSIVFHYIIAVTAIVGAILILRDVAGAAPGKGSTFLALLTDQWSNPSSYVLFSVYALLLTSLFFLLAVAVSWFIRRRRPRRQELAIAVFVASLLNIPCDFAVVDVLSEVVVQEPADSAAFVFAVGIRGLDFPILLHVLIVLGSIVMGRRIR